ncbi:hypothetical protein M2267_001050 [Ensifer sp. KUDG1]|uniref:hypothetical protein n=1 Tax=Ensifer sp. KUDG1 TaxID=3373919 RepID=UPI003D1C34C9
MTKTYKEHREFGFMHPVSGYYQASIIVYVDDETGEEILDEYVPLAGAGPFPVRPQGDHWRINDEKTAWIKMSAEEIRAVMPNLSRLRFRNAFKSAGMTTAVINAAIAAVADPSEQEDLQIAWEDAQSFKRLDPLVVLIATRAGKTADEIDAIWNPALTA